MNEALLYFSEWTAPDGTKRRPLVERVPECRPKKPHDSLEGDFWNLTPLRGCIGWHTMSDPISTHGEDDTVAAALCRCQTEDWLIAVGFGELIIGDRFVRLCPRSKYEKTITGDTIHHALVAACHAVADAQGVPQ